jgi:phosphonopyruvate decarboxylase
MIQADKFYSLFKENGINFFTGVPDSLLKNICAYITDNVPKRNHIIAANEGGALAIAAGYHLATGKIPLVYMQNSGLGNAINPLLSLLDKKVYNIPLLMLIGWRGEPGIKDEPQHIKQGEVTIRLLEAMDIAYEIIPDNFESAKLVIDKAIEEVRNYNTPFAFIIRKDLFEPYELKTKVKTEYEMNREAAIKVVVDSLGKNDIVVSTTGKTSRELFEYREELKQGHENDFLTVGSMGHASQIALGIALSKPNTQVFCFDGDGAALMHAGSMGIIGDLAPLNLKHIIFNNGSHDSVGGQPTIGYNIKFDELARIFNYKQSFSASNIADLKECLSNFRQMEGPALLEIVINKGARKDLGRPTTSPVENKMNFMNTLK